MSTIKYELLKQLKEVGYPQAQKSGLLHAGIENMTPTVLLTPGETFNLPQDDVVYEPTTDELIEELGQMFNSLHKLGTGEYCADSSLVGRHDNHYAGSTPKEALIKLYIELHKK